jgi:hypothetical protein
MKKLSDYIVELQKVLEEHGDLGVVYAGDDEGNHFSEVFFNPTIGFMDSDKQFTSLENFEVSPEDYEHLIGKKPNVVCIN